MKPGEYLREMGFDPGPTLRSAPLTQPDGPPPEMPTAAPHEGAFGRYEILGEIGRGGMGIVYSARDTELRREVAVKVLEVADLSPDLVERFVQEAQITAQLEHPSIVPVYDFGVSPDKRLYFVMKRIRGHSLREILSAKAREEPSALERWTRHRLLIAFAQICNAVAHGHARGVVHRDLKPANLMLGSFGEAVVMDWGISRVVELDGAELDHLKGKPSEIGSPIGTLGYMCPEQITGDHAQVGPESDVWALGVILYELLTVRRAYPGTFSEVLQRVLTGHLDADQLPRGLIPQELAEVIERATQVSKKDRFKSAAELGGAVGAFLEGARRRDIADARVEDGERARAKLLELAELEAELRRQCKVLEKKIAPWASLEEKRDLEAVRERLLAIEPRQARVFASLVNACERAIEQDAAHPRARALLAEVFAERLLIAEQRRDRSSREYYQDRVREYDDGALAEFQVGDGALTLRTNPPGATVLCERFDRTGLIWKTEDPVTLGQTPLEAVRLPMGSYRLTLVAPRKRPTVYPVHITRGKHWCAEAAIPLLTDNEIGAGFVYVPAGPFLSGGDPLAPGSTEEAELRAPGFLIEEQPVTMAAYCRFINDLHAVNPDLAWERVPRTVASPEGSEGQYWERPPAAGEYALPDRDVDGDAWDPLWPAMAVSWDDANAFAEWLGRKTGRRTILVPELYWEKAARGVDGRYYPWGDRFDPALCHMRQSRPGRPLPTPLGSFEHDVSVYGVRNLAGSIREWCGDLSFDGVTELRPVRGASWDDHPRLCRAATRSDQDPWAVKSQVGFRVAVPLPGLLGSSA